MPNTALRIGMMAVALVAAAGCRSSRSPYVYTPSHGATPAVDSRRPVLMAPAPTAATTATLPPASLPSTGAPSSAKVQPATVAAKPTLAAPTLKAPVPSAPASAAEKGVAVYRLKCNDPVLIYLRGIPGVAGGEQEIQDVIDENGAITMPYINSVQAAGRTTSELEQMIQRMYIDQQIYRYITVNVVVPSRSYYVRGEVRQAGRFVLLNRVTILQAIAGAGGFTDFANPSSVEVVRGATRFRVDTTDLERHPERDMEIESGDVIIVNRSIF